MSNAPPEAQTERVESPKSQIASRPTTSIDMPGESEEQQNDEIDEQGAQVVQDVAEQEGDGPDETTHTRALYKSSRFKGYLILVLASGVNYQAVHVSNNPSFFGEFSAVAATSGQRSYAIAVALISIILSSAICVAHLDCFSPMKKYWARLFQPKSRTEAYLLTALMTWWVVALWINTGINGIAGNGKGQYNLYFSSWICLLVCAWTMERWLVSCDYPALDGFLASWPNRAPGWIAIFFLSFSALLSILDLYFNWDKVDTAYIKAEYKSVQQSQWEWLIFATGFTMLPSIGFVLVEIFRETKPGEDKNTKPEWEIIMEGFVLLILFVIWIPSVIIATTPGGAASLVGNAYFFVWSSTVFVVDTCVWWIHDWRRRVLTIIKDQERAYRNIQLDVLERSKLELEMHTANTKNKEQQETAMCDDGDSLNSDSLEGQPISDIAGT